MTLPYPVPSSPAASAKAEPESNKRSLLTFT
jgi:hypothetical protein